MRPLAKIVLVITTTAAEPCFDDKISNNMSTKEIIFVRFDLVGHVLIDRKWDSNSLIDRNLYLM